MEPVTPPPMGRSQSMDDARPHAEWMEVLTAWTTVLALQKGDPQDEARAALAFSQAQEAVEQAIREPLESRLEAYETLVGELIDGQREGRDATTAEAQAAAYIKRTTAIGGLIDLSRELSSDTSEGAGGKTT